MLCKKGVPKNSPKFTGKHLCQSLFYLCNYHINVYDIDDAEPDFTKRKVMKIISLYQILYYNSHDRKEKTQLHLFIAHIGYEKCKSREVLTSLNKVGVSVGYNEVQKARNDLACFTYFRSKNAGFPIPSHFSKDKFTIGAFDNFYHSNRSFLSRKFSNQAVVMTLFQVKPEQPPKNLIKHKST